MMVDWPVQDAENRQPAVVVLAVDGYEHLCHSEKTNAPTVRGRCSPSRRMTRNSTTYRYRLERSASDVSA